MSPVTHRGLPPRLRIVLTGGPGCGKTTLIDALRTEGYACFPEVSRALIREQCLTGGDLCPWRNLPAFADECARRMRLHLVEADRLHLATAFFDRGLPDVLGYLDHARLPVPDSLANAGAGYTPVAFIAPPWRDIYRNDPERPQSFEQCVALHTRIEAAYHACGFILHTLPRASVPDRLRFIRRHLVSMPSPQPHYT